MTEDQFAKVIADSVKEDGLDSEFFDTIKKILPIRNDFYKDIPSENTLKYFKTVIDNGDLDVKDQDDYLPMASKEYWNQPNNASFVYIIRILPALRAKYPKLYMKVFDESTKRIKMPAGLDDESKKNPKAVTIWNEIEKVDSEDASGKSGRKKSFARMTDQEKNNLVKNELDNMVKNDQITQSEANSIKNDASTMKAVIQFLVKYIK